jgi:hypothetical protein
MRRLFPAIVILFFTISVKAQFNPYEGYKGAVKAGVSYVHDFPGMSGAAVYAEYVAPFNEWLQGSAGIKRIQTGGSPRTGTIPEFTRATTIDFNLFVIPFRTESTHLKVGLGYSSSMYRIQRAYPEYEKNTLPGTHLEPVWRQTNLKGRSNGMSITGEYEYFFSGNLSIGARIQYTKGYQYVIAGGPFAAVRF